MRLQRDSYAPKSCAFDAANVQFLRAHLCKSHPVLQHLKLPVPVETFLQHLGSASLAIGLLCIGAGLQWKAFKEELSLMAASSVQRLVAVPLVGWATASVFGLGAVESGVLILFAALPTAQSCYVMTASMRGNAAAVANVTTAQTLVSMVTLSVWCAFVLESLAGKV